LKKKKNRSRRKVTIINSSRRSKTRTPRTELQIATATNKTKHNTPAKALNKQTNKQSRGKKKSNKKLRNKHQTKKDVEELLRGCPSAIAVNRAAKLVTRNWQCACVLGKVSSSLSSVCKYGDRLGFETEP
jgi:uncharacterized protein (DUF927 family)